MLVTDHSCAKVSIADYCRGSNLNHSIQEVINGVWEITIEV